LASQGIGSWLGSMGHRLAASSNGVILAAVGHPEWATLYAATGKAAQLLQQVCWLVPDSGLVGLVQLHGQGDRQGTRRTVACMMHLHVLISGGAVLGLLVFNPAFVRAWVGPALYAGDYLNVLLAANLFLSALVHGAFTTVGAVSHRLLIGSLTMGYGTLYCVLAFGFSRVRGIEGLAEASLLSGVVLGLIPGLSILGRVYGYGWRAVLGDAIGPWLVRSAPFLMAAGWFGAALGDGPAWRPVGTGMLLGAAYMWWIRPLVADVPWPIRARSWLVRLRLLPSAPCKD
jgi:O-antigen/teichoic acid export membrane protein